MRIKLVISYDGTNYCGWQRQKNGVSVQETLESALYELTKESVTVTASGRTDAGVHAQGQVVHFDTESSIPHDKFYLALNPFLPKDVKALSSERVDEQFNARKSAKKKTYAYEFYISEVELPLKERYAERLERAPDLIKMRSAGEKFCGEHDFKAFSATGSLVKSTIRTIYSVDIVEVENGLKILVTGNGFLYNMVRIIAGVLLDVGLGKKTEQDIVLAFNTGKRETLGKTLPAKALTLISVIYN